MLKYLAPFLAIFGKVLDLLAGRQAAQRSNIDRQAGADAVNAQTERSTLDAISRANAAAVEQSRADLDRLHDDDGFKRPDGTGDGSGTKPAAKT